MTHKLNESLFLSWNAEQWLKLFIDLDEEWKQWFEEDGISEEDGAERFKFDDANYIADNIIHHWGNVTNKIFDNEDIKPQWQSKALKLANEVIQLAKSKGIITNNSIQERIEPQLTRGEKIALASGKELNTEAQYALMYLCQIGKTRVLPQPYRNMDAIDLCRYSGLNENTFRETGKQIRAYINDDIDSTHQLGNNKKGVAFIQKFQEMTPEEVANIAFESFDQANFDQSAAKRQTTVQDRKNTAHLAKVNSEMNKKVAAQTQGKTPASKFTPDQIAKLKSLPDVESRKAYLKSIQMEAVKVNKYIKLLEACSGQKVNLIEDNPEALNEWFGRSAYKNFVSSLQNSYKKAEALRKYDATYQDDWKGTEEAEVLKLIKQIWQTFKKTQASGDTPSFAGDDVNKISIKNKTKVAR